MSVVDESQTGAAQAAHTEQDLGPLAWVLDELRKSLEGASKAVARFVRDADAARASDLEELDTSALRIARQQLHQACGALEMRSEEHTRLNSSHLVISYAVFCL